MISASSFITAMQRKLVIINIARNAPMIVVVTRPTVTRMLDAMIYILPRGGDRR